MADSLRSKKGKTFYADLQKDNIMTEVKFVSNEYTIVSQTSHTQLCYMHSEQETSVSKKRMSKQYRKEVTMA